MKSKYVLMDHGSGGLATQELVQEVFLSRLANPFLCRLEDSAVLEPLKGQLAFTTDSYVVDPPFFPGGNIGSLAVHGTINDLAMQGAEPAALSLGLILEEGLPMEDLHKIATSLAEASKNAGVPIVAADTKVVPRGKADRIFINTSGVGCVPKGVKLGSDLVAGGDVVIVSGTIGDHGVTIMASREGLGLETSIKSDTATLHKMVYELLKRFGSAIKCFRDPTRGGLATVIHEIASASQTEITLYEEAIPVRPQVQSVCDLLGLDPLYLANEGKLVAVVAGDAARNVVEAMRDDPLGMDAAIIGKVNPVNGPGRGRAILETTIGGKRMLEPLTGEPLPRIC